jgi:hypothetical protein
MSTKRNSVDNQGLGNTRIEEVIEIMKNEVREMKKGDMRIVIPVTGQKVRIDLLFLRYEIRSNGDGKVILFKGLGMVKDTDRKSKSYKYKERSYQYIPDEYCSRYQWSRLKPSIVRGQFVEFKLMEVYLINDGTFFPIYSPVNHKSTPVFDLINVFKTQFHEIPGHVNLDLPTLLYRNNYINI